MFTIPNKLLTNESHKTKLGEKMGYTTYIMYLSPYTQNNKGINLCPNASEGCANACLFQSGNARFKQIVAGRTNKSNYYVNDRHMFMNQLLLEINIINQRHSNITSARINANGKVMYYKDFAIRLNGTSDIAFEKYKYDDGLNIFQKFPNIQFYDYTKSIHKLKRVKEMNLKNYHLTFSRSETNENECIKALKLGFNVAVVFDSLPATYYNHNVINGDETDLRFLDDKNVVVGLKYKRASVKGGGLINKEAKESNFVVF